MWIKRKEYNRLKRVEKMNNELEKEIGRLAEQISVQTENCKVGVWCKGCIHMGHDFSQVDHYSYWEYGAKDVCGNVIYCKKHLHELCPEFEMEGK